MRYDFECSTCGHRQLVEFSVADYDTLVEESGRLRDTACEECHTTTLVRYIGQAPVALGGTRGYMSMERYLSKNKGQQRLNEERARRELADRHNRNMKDMNKRKEQE